MIRLVVLAAMALALSWSPAEARCRVPWCGIYMAHYFHKSDPRFAQARRWAHEGINAGGPRLPSSSSGRITSGSLSGSKASPAYGWFTPNDGACIRTRARSLRGGIANVDR